MKFFVYSLLTACIKDTHASGTFEDSRIQVEEVYAPTQMDHEVIDNKIKVAINLEDEDSTVTIPETGSITSTNQVTPSLDVIMQDPKKITKKEDEVIYNLTAAYPCTKVTKVNDEFAVLKQTIYNFTDSTDNEDDTFI